VVVSEYNTKTRREGTYMDRTITRQREATQTYGQCTTRDFPHSYSILGFRYVVVQFRSFLVTRFL
jgi:hypothetical protein